MNNDLVLGVGMWSVIIILLPFSVRYYRHTRVNRVMKWAAILIMGPVIVIITLGSLATGDVFIGLGIAMLCIISALIIISFRSREMEHSRWKMENSWWMKGRNRRKS